MKNRTVLRAAVAAAVVVLAGFAHAAPEPSATQAEIDQLRARLDALEQQQAKTETDRAVDELVRDADRRSALLAQEGGFTAGYDEGFVLRDTDGNYEMEIEGQLQFRYVLNSSDGILEDSADVDDGFEIRRAKIQFKGHAISPNLAYAIRFAFDRNDGVPELELAYVRYDFADEWAFRAGQWKGNVFQEENTSSGRQLAVERSLVNEILGGSITDYVQGVSIIYDADQIKAEVAFIDGAGSVNSGFLNDDPNFGVEGRVEYVVMGDYKRYADFTARKTEEDLLVIGAGADYTATGDVYNLLHTVDAQYEIAEAGLGLFGAYNGRLFDGETDNGYDFGVLVQAGYLLPDTDEKWEVFGRVGYLQLDDAPSGESDFYEITAGVNHYFSGHDAKVTIDAGYLPNGSPDAVTGAGITAFTDTQFVIRGQFQLLL